MKIKKKQERGQTLFDIHTKGTFEPLDLFSPGSFDDTQEEEHPFFGSVFKTSRDKTSLSTITEEDDEPPPPPQLKLKNLYLKKKWTNNLEK